jgi:hypothetical protein
VLQGSGVLIVLTYLPEIIGNTRWKHPKSVSRKIFTLEINFIIVDDVSPNDRRSMDAECLI